MASFTSKIIGEDQIVPNDINNVILCDRREIGGIFCPKRIEKLEENIISGSINL